MNRLLLHWQKGQSVRTLREAFLRYTGEYPYHRGKRYNYVDEVLPRDWRRVASPVVCEVGTGDECHVWRFGLDHTGRPMIRVRGNDPAPAVHFSYLNTLPAREALDFDPELAVVHTCPLPFCVRPEHLTTVHRDAAAEADCRIADGRRRPHSEHPFLFVHRGEAPIRVLDVPYGHAHECHHTISVDPASGGLLTVCVVCGEAASEIDTDTQPTAALPNVG